MTQTSFPMPGLAKSLVPDFARLVTLIAGFCLFAMVQAVLPTTAGAAVFEAHQTHIEALSQANAPDPDDPAEVFRFVLENSAEVIKVGPTENYSYFKFYSQGLEWQGNMRLEIENGPAEVLHFAYFVVPAPWHLEELGTYQTFSADEGLTITQNGRFDYTLEYDGLSRQLLLNDITGIELPDEMRGAGEQYLGQVNDESGLRFYLMFDPETLEFGYFLDEKAPFLDQLTVMVDTAPRLMVGIRTGFVFIEETEPARKRLIGVYEDNILRNNYFDGPFDQLPDAKRGDISVREAFSQIDPEFANEIDEFGNFLNQEGARLVIAPYLNYWGVEDFEVFAVCFDQPAGSIEYRNCLRDALEAALNP